ncbi:hypothetical protein RAA17_21810 [Komagataeibacter rhaeticus]|nr:hypothetical protein [Komagataeibacter rhaeticus]
MVALTPTVRMTTAGRRLPSPQASPSREKPRSSLSPVHVQVLDHKGQHRAQ